MIDKISQLIKEAMKAREKSRLLALRYMKSLLLENKTSKSPIESLDVIIKHYKKISDSLEMYKKDEEKINEINSELKVIKEFMPKEMEEAEVLSLITEIKSRHENPNMGMVMKELSALIKGKFNGKRATELVKKNL